jgi:hypothetical protein
MATEGAEGLDETVAIDAMEGTKGLLAIVAFEPVTETPLNVRLELTPRVIEITDWSVEPAIVPVSAPRGPCP